MTGGDPAPCNQINYEMNTKERESDTDSVKPEFDTIVEKYADFVYNVAFRMMGKAEDAENVS